MNRAVAKALIDDAAGSDCNGGLDETAVVVRMSRDDVNAGEVLWNRKLRVRRVAGKRGAKESDVFARNESQHAPVPGFEGLGIAGIRFHGIPGAEDPVVQADQNAHGSGGRIRCNAHSI